MHGPATEDRPLGPALRRGARRRCPNCGEGHLFSGYLSVVDRCAVCGEPYWHQRADDGPAYLTILIVGHALIPAFHLGMRHLRDHPLAMALAISAFAVALSLWLLPRLKGGVVAFQWARRMHGFGDEPQA